MKKDARIKAPVGEVKPKKKSTRIKAPVGSVGAVGYKKG